MYKGGEFMKEINVEEAASWSPAEFVDNIRYLEERTRYTEVARAKQVREDDKTKKPTKRGE